MALWFAASLGAVHQYLAKYLPWWDLRQQGIKDEAALDMAFLDSLSVRSTITPTPPKDTHMDEALRRQLLLAYVVASAHSLHCALWALRDVPGEEPSIWALAEASAVVDASVANWLAALDRPRAITGDDALEAVRLARELVTAHVEELDAILDQIGVKL